MRKIKSDDEVMVIAGRDKGKRGKVVKVLSDGRLIVSGVHMVKKHQKPNPQAGVAGGIVGKEAPIQASNVAIFNPATEKADRVAFKFVEDGESTKKIRVFKSNGEAIDP
ncbi:50S ribosomal protein L24 [Candidatus Endobugula sertula]|uniref:Large ribosomal subunit protein uL24 n=1 Tax=Candidatus Endobugula sertula TaxID=62101 RepID=A0A1D2QTI5_9GAMM|nr:50S ribosomal protein L24 [Candidatus Endobugula sertula]